MRNDTHCALIVDEDLESAVDHALHLSLYLSSNGAAHLRGSLRSCPQQGESLAEGAGNKEIAERLKLSLVQRPEPKPLQEVSSKAWS
jgi:hypothetical protein